MHAICTKCKQEQNMDPSYRATTTRYKNSMGMCKRYGDSGYIPIPVPKSLLGKA